MLKVLLHFAAYLFALLAVGGLGYLGLSLWSEWRFLVRRRAGRGRAVGNYTPGISILKPLRGSDRQMYESFRSHCLQDYPQYEIIFGVSEAGDAAVAEVERLRQEFPGHEIRLVVCAHGQGANRKVSNLAEMMRVAKYGHIVINDSDIRVERDYLRRIVAPMAPREAAGVAGAAAPAAGAGGYAARDAAPAAGAGGYAATDAAPAAGVGYAATDAAPAAGAGAPAAGAGGYAATDAAPAADAGGYAATDAAPAAGAPAAGAGAPAAGAGVGLVTALYRAEAGSRAGWKSLASRMEAVTIASDFAGGVLCAMELEGGLHFGLGSTLAFPRAAAEAIGGLETLVGYLADDHELGRMIWEAGYEVVLSDTVVETFLPEYGFGAMVEHQLRWARTVRDLRKWGYVGVLLTFGLPWAMAAVLCAGGAAWSWALLGVVAVARYASGYILCGPILKDRQTLSDLWLIPARDLVGLAIWFASFGGDTIVWRGERFHLKDGRLTRA